MKRTWIRPIEQNDRASSVLRLTNAKAVLPKDSFVTGEADDPNSPPAGKTPITIEWGTNGRRTKHFIREDTNKYMITHRMDPVRDFYSRISGTDRKIAITHIGSHDFLVTPVEE